MGLFMRRTKVPECHACERQVLIYRAVILRMDSDPFSLYAAPKETWKHCLATCLHQRYLDNLVTVWVTPFQGTQLRMISKPRRRLDVFMPKLGTFLTRGASAGEISYLTFRLLKALLPFGKLNACICLRRGGIWQPVRSPVG